MTATAAKKTATKTTARTGAATARTAGKTAAKAPARKTPAKAPAAKVRAYRVPKGYAVKWQHGGHDLLAKTTAKEGPAWYAACNEHGDLHEAKTAREAEQVGALAQRSKWCTGDHKPAAKKTPAKKTAPAKK